MTMSSKYLRRPEYGITVPTGDPLNKDIHVGWLLRYAPDQMTREDQLEGASIIAAYMHMVYEATQRKRAWMVRELRRDRNDRMNGESDA